MPISTLQRGIAAAALAALLTPALAANEHPSVKRPYSLPPSADLDYTVKVSQRGMTLNGEATVGWRGGADKYSIVQEAKVPMFGKVLENRSEGTVDDYGLAPLQASEKKLRKDATTVSFKRDGKTISFSESQETYPIKGGEQDRTSAPWQLLAVARGAPDKFTPGSEWAFFVAGRRDAEQWLFKVVGKEQVATGQGEVSALHLTKAASPDSHGQTVDIWLAPSLEWYPVKVRLVEHDGDYFEQVLQKVTAK